MIRLISVWPSSLAAHGWLVAKSLSSLANLRSGRDEHQRQRQRKQQHPAWPAGCSVSLGVTSATSWSSELSRLLIGSGERAGSRPASRPGERAAELAQVGLLAYGRHLATGESPSTFLRQVNLIISPDCRGGRFVPSWLLGPDERTTVGAEACVT